MVGSRVYVGGLPFGVRERDLEKFFKGFGRTRDILIKNGYGFVEFEDYRDADDAVYELNGKELLGERVVVEPARGIDRGDRYRRDRYSRDRYGRQPSSRYESSQEKKLTYPRSSDNNYRYGPPTRTEYRLIVENLSSRISWQDLKDYMRQAGEVTYADAHKQHRNEGVVEFATHSDMRAALEKLDGTELNGRRVRLVEDRRGGRRRSRSSSSRSRSRSRPRRSSRSRSKSRRSSRSRSRSKSRPKSKSPVAKSRSRSRSKARSASPRSRSASAPRRSQSKSPEPNNKERSMSRERSRSRSKDVSPARQSRSRDDERRKSKSHSRSRSQSRSASRSRSRSRSPRQNGDDKARADSDPSPRSGD